MANEHNIQSLIQLAVSKFTKGVLFRNNVGTGWVGNVRQTTGSGIYIDNARPLHAGLCRGSSDLIGWTKTEITQEMVGKTVAIFTAIEVKKIKGSVTSSDQLNFLNKLRESGGIAGIAKSDTEAIALINSFGQIIN